MLDTHKKSCDTAEAAPGNPVDSVQARLKAQAMNACVQEARSTKLGSLDWISFVARGPARLETHMESEISTIVLGKLQEQFYHGIDLSLSGQIRPLKDPSHPPCTVSQTSQLFCS